MKCSPRLFPLVWLGWQITRSISSQIVFWWQQTQLETQQRVRTPGNNSQKDIFAFNQSINQSIIVAPIVKVWVKCFRFSRFSRLMFSPACLSALRTPGRAWDAKESVRGRAKCDTNEDGANYTMMPLYHYDYHTTIPLHHRVKMPTMQGLYCEKRQRFHWRDMRDDGGLMQDKQRCIHKL